jgi:fibronectin-binding autotransporter adhesin
MTHLTGRPLAIQTALIGVTLACFLASAPTRAATTTYWWDTSTAAGLQGGGNLTIGGSNWSTSTAGSSPLVVFSNSGAVVFDVGTSLSSTASEGSAHTFATWTVDGSNSVEFVHTSNISDTFLGGITVQGSSTMTWAGSDGGILGTPSLTVQGNSTNVFYDNNSGAKIFAFGALTFGATGANLLRSEDGTATTNLVFTGVTGGAGNSIDLGSTNITGTASGSGLTTLTMSNANSSTFGGTIFGTGNLVVSNTGTLALTGSTTYTGVTTVSGGTLVLQGNASMTSASTVRTTDIGGPGATLVVQGNATLTTQGVMSLGSSSGANPGNVVQTGGAVTVAGSNDGNIRSLIIGEWAGESSTYGLSGGTLNVPNGITYVNWNATAGNLNISGGLAKLNTIQFGANGGSFSGFLNLSGTGSLYVGPGGITSGTSSTGNINLSGGTLGAYASWSSSLPMSLGGAVTIDTGGNGITLSGVLSDSAGTSGSLTKIGSGTLTLAGNGNSYSGPTTVSNGTLRIGGPGALSSGSLAVNSSTLDLSATGPTPQNFFVAALNLSSGSLNFGITGGANNSDTINAGGLITLTGINTINLVENGATPQAGDTYTLLTGSGTAGTGSLRLGSTFAIGFNHWLFGSVGNSYTAAVVGTPTPSSAYWTGSVSSIWSDASQAPHSNWSTDVTGGTDTQQVPGSTTDVYLAANGAGNLATTLGTDFYIQSLHMIASTTASMSIAGSNTLTIGGSGGITVDSGAGGLTIGTGGLALAVAQTWTNNAANPLTVNAVLSGGSALTTTGSGTIVLGGANTFTGGLTINAGVLQLANTGALNSAAPNAVSFTPGSSGTLQLNGNSVAVSGLSTDPFNAGAPIVMNASGGSAALVVNTASANTYAGTIQDGPGGGPLFLAKAGSGSLYLAGSNNYTGGTILTVGNLTLGNAAAIGSGPLMIVGGTLDSGIPSLVLSTNNPQVWNGSFTFLGTNDLNLGKGAVSYSGVPTLTVSAGNLEVDGAVTGNASTFTKAGAGTLILTGSNSSASGAWDETGGTLQLQGNASLNLTGATNAIAIAIGASSGPTMILQDNATILTQGFVKIGSFASGNSGNVVQSSGLFTINGVDTANQNRALTIGEFQSETSTYSLSGGTLNVPNGVTFVPYHGTGNLNISGGVANLNTIEFGQGSGSYTGYLNLSGTGSLYVGSGGLVLGGTGATANINLSGGTLGAYASWSSSLSMSLGPVTIDSGSNAITLSGVLSDSAGTSGSLTKVGGGTLTLVGNGNSYSGPTTVSNGTLRIANAGALSSGSLAVNSSTLDLSAAGSPPVGFSIAAVNLSGGTLNFGIAGGANNSETLNSSGLITLTGANTINLVSVGATPQAGDTYTLLTGSGIAGTGTLSLGNTAPLGGFNSWQFGSIGTSYTATVVGAPTPSTAYWTGLVSSIWSDASQAPLHSNWSTDISGGTDTQQLPGSTTDVYLAANGAGNLATTLGMDFSIQSLHMIASTTSAMTIAGSNKLTIGGGGITVDSGAGGLTISAGGVVLGSGQTWTNNAANPLTVNSVLSGGGGLTVSGSGSFVLGGGNTFSGGIAIDAGALLVLATTGALNAAAPNAVSFTYGSSGALQLNGNSVTVSGLSTDPFNAGAPVVMNASAGSATLTVNVTGASAYAGSIQDGPGLGALSLVKAGSGMLSLAGSSGYSGGTTLSAGNLTLGDPSAIGSGPLTITGGTLESNTSTPMSIGGNVPYSGSPTVIVDSANLEFDGVLSGSSAFTKNGVGALILTGSGSTSTGEWLLAGGTLQLQGNASLSILNGSGNRSLNVTSPSTATLVVQDNATLYETGQMGMGDNAGGYSGNVFQSGGVVTVLGVQTANQNRSLLIGEFAGETSSYYLSGGTLDVPNGTTFACYSGTGSSLVISGGLAELQQLKFGAQSNDEGNLDLSGTGALYLGSGGVINGSTSGVFDTYAINLDGGTLGAYASWSSSLSMTLGGPVTIDSGSNAITLSGALSDSGISNGILAKVGSGTLTLSGSNTYGGGTFVENGTLIAANNEAIGDGTNLYVGSPASLALFGTVQPAVQTAAPTGGVASVPEPGTLALLGIALCAAAVDRRIRSRRQKPKHALSGV